MANEKSIKARTHRTDAPIGHARFIVTDSKQKKSDAKETAILEKRREENERKKKEEKNKREKKNKKIGTKP